MLILDNILLSPARGLLFLLREIHHAAEQEAANEGQAIRAELSDLYMLLETGRITEGEFNAREEQLLSRLDDIAAAGRQDRSSAAEDNP